MLGEKEAQMIEVVYYRIYHDTDFLNAEIVQFGGNGHGDISISFSSDGFTSAHFPLTLTDIYILRDTLDTAGKIIEKKRSLKEPHV